MQDYDFSKFNDKEFEAFTIELLSLHFRVNIERFKPGKDSGVDGRFFCAVDGEVILQCKHWIKSGVEALIRYLKRKESKKVQLLRPNRYIFVTSLPLSRNDKTAIQSAMRPFIQTTEDIFGQEDLNSILSKFPAIEERHYKLWFSSVTIMTRLQNIAIKGRSNFKLCDARDFAVRYVPTSRHQEAKQLLETLGILIVTGEPGIGKSTMAEQIALQYAVDGYELCCIADSVEEAEAIWEDDRRQLFYFDDFLGRNYLLALNRHEDSHIMAFIRRIRKDKLKRFVLTSRTTVLQRGKSLTELFKIENVVRSEYELRIEDLSLLERARILYSHVWNSDLGSEFIDRIYEEARYMEIVQHPNYNPRLISFVTDAQKVGAVPSNKYWEYILEMLQNPKEVWAHVLDNQLNVESRILVRLVVFNGKDILEASLMDSFIRYKKDGFESGEFTDEYNLSIRIAVGSVLKRTIIGVNDVAVLSLFNPSLGDFVIRRYGDSPVEIQRTLHALRNESSLTNLIALRRAALINRTDYFKILLCLSKRMLNDGTIDISYRIALAGICCDEGHGSISESLHTFVKGLPCEDDSIYPGTQAEVLRYGISANLIPRESELYINKIRGLLDGEPEKEELPAISELIGELPINSQSELMDEFCEYFVKVWSNDIDKMLVENGVLDGVDSIDDLEEARTKVRDYLEREAADCLLLISQFEVSAVLEAVDYEWIVQQNVNRNWSPVTPPKRSAAAKMAIDEMAAIHELFERP